MFYVLYINMFFSQSIYCHELEIQTIVELYFGICSKIYFT